MLGQSHKSIRTAYLRAAGIQVDPDLYSKNYRKIYHDLLDKKLVVRPGAIELVNKLRSHGFLLAVVSSSSSASVLKILKSIHLENAFDVQITSDDVKEPKPDPTPYLLALKKLGVSALNAIAFEDSPSGVEAAIHARVRVIAVRHAFNMEQSFDGTIAILDSFSDVEIIFNLIQEVFASGKQE
jgi:HAD superfamily hydrolase (TIGR01509 family)